MLIWYGVFLLFMVGSYTIGATSAGRAGWISYRETSLIRFPWELAGFPGIIIEVPRKEAWDRFCESQNAAWAKARRDTIVGRIANWAARERYWGGSFEVTETGLEVYPAVSFMHALAGRVGDLFRNG